MSGNSGSNSYGLSQPSGYGANSGLSTFGNNSAGRSWSPPQGPSGWMTPDQGTRFPYAMPGGQPGPMQGDPMQKSFQIPYGMPGGQPGPMDGGRPSPFYGMPGGQPGPTQQGGQQYGMPGGQPGPTGDSGGGFGGGGPGLFGGSGGWNPGNLNPGRPNQNYYGPPPGFQDTQTFNMGVLPNQSQPQFSGQPGNPVSSFAPGGVNQNNPFAPGGVFYNGNFRGA